MPKYTITINIDTDSCDPFGVATEIHDEAEEALNGDAKALTLLGNAFGSWADESEDDEDSCCDDTDDVVVKFPEEREISSGLAFNRDEHARADGWVYSNIVGPTYTAQELRIIATHTIVALASAPGVSDAVRLQAAQLLSQKTTELVTESTTETEE